MYTSLWFRKTKLHVEQRGYDWYILSAKYGLVHRDEVIAPYEQTLKRMKIQQRRIWADHVLNQILQLQRQSNVIHIFAGVQYREFLVPALEEKNYLVKVPLKGLGIGKQLQWLTAG